MGVLESVVRVWCGCSGECSEEGVVWVCTGECSDEDMVWVCVPDIVVRRIWCGRVYRTL